MSTCSKCGAVLPENANFCGVCGTPAPQPPKQDVCPVCGSTISENAKFCSSCGTRLTADPAPVPTETPVPAPETGTPSSFPAPPTPKKTAKPIPKRALLFGGIGAGALVVIAAVILLVTGLSGNKESSSVLYLKDSEIAFANTDSRKIEPYELTENLTSGEDVDNEDLADAAYSLSDYIAFSEDGKRVFYPDRVDDNGFGLYTREVNKPKKDAIKIDSNVRSYAITADGKSILYVKGDDGNLFRHDLEQKVKLASGVKTLFVAENCEKIAYISAENDFYILNENGEAEKIISAADNYQQISDDLSTVYFMRDNTLYKQSLETEERITIASDIYSIAYIYETGEVYFTRENTVSSTLMDYVNDDLAESDAAITEPESPEYPEEPKRPTKKDFESDEEYEAAYEEYKKLDEAYDKEVKRLREEYDQAYSLYYQKQDRDYLRDELKNAPFEYTLYSLHYFDGTEEHMLTDQLPNHWDREYAYDTPVILFPVAEQLSTEKLTFSALQYAYEVSDMLTAAQEKISTSLYAAVGASVSEISSDEIRYFDVSSDGSRLFFLYDVSENDTGDLYTADIADGLISSPAVYDTEVSDNYIFFGKDSKLHYYKNFDSERSSGDLFIDQTEIDYDVSVYRVSYLEDSVIFCTDVTSDGNSAALKLFDGSETTLIADDINSYTLTDGDLFYFTDYSTDHYRGTLNLYRDKKSIVIDEDVCAVLTPSPNTVYGSNY